MTHRLPAVLVAIALCSAPAHSESGEISFKATSANVKESGVPIRIRITRWSTEEERAPLLAALNPPARIAPPGDAAGARGAAPAGRGGGAARGAAGRGGPARGGGDPPNPI